ncbi:hypothetical protein R0K04_25470, partial [Pseudoalteromonas sp. SIMBA_153]
METALDGSHMNKHNNKSEPNQLSDSTVCVLIGHSIEAITSAVVLASFGQCVHLYADKALLTQQ